MSISIFFLQNRLRHYAYESDSIKYCRTTAVQVALEGKNGHADLDGASSRAPGRPGT